MTPSPLEPRRLIPAAGKLLQDPAFSELLRNHSRSLVLDAIRISMDEARQSRKAMPVSTVDWARNVASQLDFHQRPSLRRVINATGVVLHTNLGRAPIPRDILMEVVDVASGYSNLEIDLKTGKRGSRHEHLSEVLARTIGSEDAIVVNNNAAALVLTLHALAAGKEAIVSRGELVEIGGSFRIPDIMEASGVTLREVGTTNRTRIGDYARAFSKQTAMLLKVHPSNFRIVGFTEEASARDLVQLGRKKKLPVVFDLGSAAVRSPALMTIQLPKPQDLIRMGADVVLFSGDKLLGGPQAGIIVGKRKALARLRKDPWLRILRSDKLAIAILDRLLRSKNPSAVELLLSRTLSSLNAHAERLASELAILPEPWKTKVVSSTSMVGGGSLPEEKIPSAALVIEADSRRLDALDRSLRMGEFPVISLRRKREIQFDMRTILDDEFFLLPDLIQKAIRSASESAS